MKKTLLMLLPIMVFVAIFMTSCSDDDSDSRLSFDKSTIVGTWEITSVSSSIWWRVTEGATLTFNSDGTCTGFHSMEDSYEIDGGVVKTYYEETGEPMYVYSLLSVSSNVYTVKIGGTLDESDESVTVTMVKK